ncbi:MAG: ECF-type sigma factor [Planctomycetota bacterium]|jgi:RNA polymerase sigma factor (TIGR02999 family)
MKPSTAVGGSGVGEADRIPETANDLMPKVYEQLRALAAGYLRRDTNEPMLEPAVLVNEAYLRLAAQPPGSWKSKEHFMAVAAMAMRKILIDQARRRCALKRGFGRARVSLELVTKTGPREIDILEVDDALNALAEINKRASRGVEMRFFAGLTHDEVARALGVSRKTVVNDWMQARSWLAAELADKSALRS